MTFAIVPAGTANNIARTLGLPVDDALAGIQWWNGDVEVRPYHLSTVRSKGRAQVLVEGAGLGCFAETIRQADAIEAAPGAPVDVWRVWQEVLGDAREQALQVVVDGCHVDGLYLAAHASQVREFGPNLTIAPRADPHREHVEVALVGAEHRGALRDYVDRRRRGQHPPPVSFPTMTGKFVRLRTPSVVATSCDDAATIDDTGDLAIEAATRPVRMLVPR
jgi:diacylglycerol kinase (ATP)